MRLVLGSWGGAPAAIVFALIAACAHGTDPGAGGVADDAGTSEASAGDATRPPGSSGGTGTGADAGCNAKVVVNEVMSQGSTANDEFVELYNPASCDVSLAGWTLLYRSSANKPGATLYSFQASDSIAARTFQLFATASLPGKTGTLTPGMAASDGQVGLVDGAGTLVDGVGWGSATGDYVEKSATTAPPNNGSIARRSDGVDTDDNSADFRTASSPTPGQKN